MRDERLMRTATLRSWSNKTYYPLIMSICLPIPVIGRHELLLEMEITMYRRTFSSHHCLGNRPVTGQPFTVEVPRPGKYKVTVTLNSEKSLENVSIYTGPENLTFTGSIPPGIFKHITVVNVGDIAPDDQRRICQDRAFTITVKAETDCFTGLSVNEISCPTIYIAATTDRSNDLENKSCSCGSNLPPSEWIKMFSAYTGQRIAVSNRSRSGLTTESFRKEGHYAAVNEYSRPGDFYFFAFDPTGQSMEDWKSGGICRRQLTRYIIECRERLAYPVLFTPVARNCGEKICDHIGQLWEQCIDAYREIATVTMTPLIELHKISVMLCDAYVMAGYAAREIARVCGSCPEQGYRFLAKNMCVIKEEDAFGTSILPALQA